MGNAACTGSFKDVTFPNPKDPRLNKCSEDFDDFIGSSETNICYNSTSGQKYIAERFCTSIGNGEEWRLKRDAGFGCCRTGSAQLGKGEPAEVTSIYAAVALNDQNGCAGICDNGNIQAVVEGKRGECQRIRFAGDPTVCCFLDYTCNRREDLCFQTVDRGRTCPPEFRNLSGSACLEQIRPYCTGEAFLPGQENWWDLWVEDVEVNINSGDTGSLNPGGSKFIPVDFKPPSKESLKRMMKQPCMNALARAISADSQFCTWEDLKKIQYARGNFDSKGLTWAQGVVNEIFDKYTKDFGSFVGGITSSGKQISEMESVFYEICTKFPILCQEPLKSVCQNVTSEQIASGTVPRADVWCGCYMPDGEYEKYVDRYGVNKECSPFCNTAQAIPLADEDGYEKRCLQDICIIDDLRLDFIRNKADGDVNFSLLCGGCGGKNIEKTITDGEDFSTSRSKIVGIFSNTILDTQVCQTVDLTNPFTDIFGNNGDTATVVMFSTNEPTKKINVTLRLNIDNIASQSGLDQYSISFVSSEIIDEEYKFTNGESLSIEGVILPCNIFALTVRTTFRDSNKSSRFLLRNRETAGAQCTCILEGTSISIVDSTIQGVNLVQNCGGTKCYNDDQEQIPCSTNNIDSDFPDFYPVDDAKRLNKKKIEEKNFNLSALIILGVVIFLFIVAIAILFTPVRIFSPSPKDGVINS